MNRARVQTDARSHGIRMRLGLRGGQLQSLLFNRIGILEGELQALHIRGSGLYAGIDDGTHHAQVTGGYFHRVGCSVSSQDRISIWRIVVIRTERVSNGLNVAG